MSNQDFKNKTVLITGAAAGIGFASAQMFAERGARVVLSDLDADAIRQVAQRLVE